MSQAPSGRRAVDQVSPTLLRHQGFRYFFFSREEPRPHVHVTGAEGEAKYWLDPSVALAWSSGLRSDQLSDIAIVVEEHQDAFRAAWFQHFGR